MLPKISVLVPVYNVVKYLPKCLESLKAQTFTDFEIVAIDDGSEDLSLSILQEYAKADKRMRIISQKNEGIASVRNRLLLQAKGEYFIFVDSDDWLTQDCLEILYARAKQTGADVIQAWYEEYDEDTDIYTPCNHLYHLYHGPKPPVRIQERFKAARAYLQVWGRLTRWDLVQKNRLKFLPGKLAEDTAFSIELYLCASHIEFIEKPVLVYRRSNKASLSHQRRRMKFDMLEQWCHLTEWCGRRHFKNSQLYNELLHLMVKGCVDKAVPWSAHEEKQMQLVFLTVSQNASKCSWYRVWRYVLFAGLAHKAPPKWVSRLAWLLR